MHIFKYPLRILFDFFRREGLFCSWGAKGIHESPFILINLRGSQRPNVKTGEQKKPVKRRWDEMLHRSRLVQVFFPLLKKMPKCTRITHITQPRCRTSNTAPEPFRFHLLPSRLQAVSELRKSPGNGGIANLPICKNDSMDINGHLPHLLVFSHLALSD